MREGVVLPIEVNRCAGSWRPSWIRTVSMHCGSCRDSAHLVVHGLLAVDGDAEADVGQDAQQVGQHALRARRLQPVRGDGEIGARGRLVHRGRLERSARRKVAAGDIDVLEESGMTRRYSSGVISPLD
jgi:hypothetical protein